MQMCDLAYLGTSACNKYIRMDRGFNRNSCGLEALKDSILGPLANLPII